MKFENLKFEAKLVDDWAKLLFDVLSRIGLLSAFAVIANREHLFWLKVTVGVAALCLGYWIIFTSILRFRELRPEEAWKEQSATLGGRIRLAVIMLPVMIAIAMASFGAVQAVIALSRVQRAQAVICLPPGH